MELKPVIFRKKRKIQTFLIFLLDPSTSAGVEALVEPGLEANDKPAEMEPRFKSANFGIQKSKLDFSYL